MALKLSKFNALDTLKTEKDRAAFLEASLLDNEEMGVPTVEDLQRAIELVAKSRKITKTKLAKDAEISRQGVYSFFSKGNSPQFSTVIKMFNALGMEISIRPKQKHPEIK